MDRALLAHSAGLGGAYRLNVPVTVFSNAPFRVPQHPLVSRVVVDGGFDAADDRTAERRSPRRGDTEQTADFWPRF